MENNYKTITVAENVGDMLATNLLNQGIKSLNSSQLVMVEEAGRPKFAAALTEQGLEVSERELDVLMTIVSKTAQRDMLRLSDQEEL